ncbi:glycosyltransferase family 2 protein [Pseudoclavibacter sp. 13-3]|uniref:glycosyltransferase family 2 protein n=1 Tax=Pseudoclavibacter sp. 13-3 TaxID=2901228 RepID=UPI001E2C4549|nr:glycosyltransferase family 2 protein [Pseudoclavibacter sp. 13-3]MCD7102109.1 glycosyltransferase [Pseudoclavibacter sp. 13-3]
MSPTRLLFARLIAILVAGFGMSYIVWRWSETIAWSAAWLAVPLVVAETYYLAESLLYALTMWNARRRPRAPAAPEGRTVDIFITTYNEPLDLVLRTAIAAQAIRYPHQTWILDDGDRSEFRLAARRIGVGYITRGPEWAGRPRLAKAGNINNALFRTDGEFFAVLDADQVPSPDFLDAVLGYFADDRVAFVQTPQEFWNIGRRDPLGSRAELFYGPIQQGKDGWDAAFFCGSNAVLRREAVMALGLSRMPSRARVRIRRHLRRSRHQLTALRSSVRTSDPAAAHVLTDVLAAIDEAGRSLRRAHPLAAVVLRFRARVQAAHSTDLSLPFAVEEVLAGVLQRMTVTRSDSALAVQPVRTTSITEDMATAMHLHALGWSSVFHDEVLVRGLAPEHIRDAIAQRHRWATGTMQVFFTQNPLFVRGLSTGQRLMYLATMTSYLSGFAAVALLSAPIVFLTTGIAPMEASALDFAVRFVPLFVLCQLLFLVSGWRRRGLWRGQQLSIALFPTWIRASVDGLLSAVAGRPVQFTVTPKSSSGADRSGLRAVTPQLVVLGLLLTAGLVGGIRLITGATDLQASLLAFGWTALDVVLLSVVIGAARYRGPDPTTVREPSSAEDALFADIVARTASRQHGAEGPSHSGFAAAVEPCSPGSATSLEGPVTVRSDAVVFRPDAVTLDSRAALRLRNEIAGFLDGDRLVLVDVAGVERVTPAGLAGMLQLLHLVRAEGADLRLFGISAAMRRAHEAYRLNLLTPIHRHERDALCWVPAPVPLEKTAARRLLQHTDGARPRSARRDHGQ